MWPLQSNVIGPNLTNEVTVGAATSAAAGSAIVTELPFGSVFGHFERRLPLWLFRFLPLTRNLHEPFSTHSVIHRALRGKLNSRIN